MFDVLTVLACIWLFVDIFRKIMLEWHGIMPQREYWKQMSIRKGQKEGLDMALQLFTRIMSIPYDQLQKELKDSEAAEPEIMEVVEKLVELRRIEANWQANVNAESIKEGTE
jgi:hypothetical protein